MKFNFLIFFIIMSICSADVNTNASTIDLDKFLSDMQDNYHLKIIQKEKVNIILTGHTIFEQDLKRNYTYSCLKINF